MKIIADGGSTKIDWVLYDDDTVVSRCCSEGLNPSLLSQEAIVSSLRHVVEEHPAMLCTEKIEFYGAGCNVSASPVMADSLRTVFPSARTVVVDSDMIGAAKVLCGDEEGIACILGTGANSCLWDGKGIAMQTPALGYILGDEGSGAVLGKLFLNALYKGVLPVPMREDFEQEYGVDMTGVIEHVYRMPRANAWLASLAPFVLRHISDVKVRELVRTNFDMFIRRNILPYRRPDLPVSFVGSIAHHFQQPLSEVLTSHGLVLGTTCQSPMDAFCLCRGGKETL